MKFKKALYSNEMGGFIVILEDKRCALVGIEKKTVDIDIFLETYLKWGAFDSEVVTPEEIEEIKKVLENPKEVYESSLAEEYLNNIETREKIDNLRKELNDKRYD